MLYQVLSFLNFSESLAEIKARFRTCLSMPRLFLNLGQKVVIDLVQTVSNITGICKVLNCKDLHGLENPSIPK